MHKIVICLFTLILLLPLGAAAGTIRLPQTGQTSCYDSAGAVIPCAGTGQDGDKRMGAAWPNPRFSASGDCVSDNLTGLIWTRDFNLAGARTWQGALDWIDTLNSTGGLCSFTDWRLPNPKELYSLFNSEYSYNPTWLRTMGFNGSGDGPHWSSSTYAINSNDAWVFGGGGVYNYNKTNYSFFVWPVRGGY